jgi:hypothetical protein
MSKFFSFFSSNADERRSFNRMEQVRHSETAHSVAIRILLAQSRLMSMR